MTINSSINFFVYCFANSAFREELYERVSQLSITWFVNSMSDETAETTMIPMQERVNLLPREPVVGAKEAASMRHINASSNGKQDREELETENGETTLNSG